jgi:hypothetical protein
VQLIRLAASRAAWTAGKSNPTSTPMIEMTTNNSTKVNPVLGQLLLLCILLIILRSRWKHDQSALDFQCVRQVESLDVYP